MIGMEYHHHFLFPIHTGEVIEYCVGIFNTGK